MDVESLDLSQPGDAARVLEVQKLAYRVEADLIGFDGIPPLYESLEALIAEPSSWIGIRVEGRVAAALAYRLEDGLCGIDRLVVDPAYFGRDFGSALVASLLHYPHITVSTGTANLPARRLYEKHGFEAIGEREIALGVTVTRYERHLDSE